MFSSARSLSERIWLWYRHCMKRPVENVSFPLQSVPKINVFVSELWYTTHVNRLTFPRVHRALIISFCNSHWYTIAWSIWKTRFLRWFISSWNSAAWASFIFWYSLIQPKASWNLSTTWTTWQSLVIMFCMFLYLLNEMGLPLSPIVCRRPQMLSSWKGQLFYHQRILCTCISSSHYWGWVTQHCVPPILFIVDARSL